MLKVFRPPVEVIKKERISDKIRHLENHWEGSVLVPVSCLVAYPGSH